MPMMTDAVIAQMAVAAIHLTMGPARLTTETKGWAAHRGGVPPQFKEKKFHQTQIRKTKI